MMKAIKGKRFYQTLIFGGIEETEDQNDGAHVQGRDPELIAARNEHILCRFVWLVLDGSKNYDWALEQLRQEFYLSKVTLSKIIDANTVQITLMRRNPDVKGWDKKYPPREWK